MDAGVAPELDQRRWGTTSEVISKMAHGDTHRMLHGMFNDRKFDQIPAHLAPGFMYEDLAQGLTIKTPEEFIDYLNGWVQAFSDGKIDSVTYLDGADFSVATFHGRGHNDGPFAGFPATGKTIDTPTCEVYHYASDGTVLSGENYFDSLTILRQLGLAPDPTAEIEGLEPVVRRMFAAFDTLDLDAAKTLMADKAQGVDEISRRWMRGKDALVDYFGTLQGQVSDIRSELRDLHETIYGDTGIATCWLEQDYTMDGERVHVSAPTTLVLHREHGEWLVALVHTIPLDEEATA